MKNIVALLLLLALSFSLSAKLNLPTRKIGNKEYYYRQVKKKETIYGISKELGIAKEDIVKYNPSVASGLQKDQLLYFPVSDFTENKTQKRSTHYHNVEQGETLYGISKTYNVSIDDLRKANPELANGLKSGTAIIIPTSNSSSLTPYVIKKGETLYRVSKNNQVSIDAILAANPGISANNFKAGTTIMIPSADNANAIDDSPETVFVAEKVEKGDSFESVAGKYNIPTEELKDANPQTNKLKKGNFVYVPVTQQSDSISSEEITAKYNTIHNIDSVGNISISLLFPFESNSTEPSTKSYLYRDFYCGFLMALNQFTEKDIRITLNVYDTSSKSIDSIEQDGALKKSNYIFIAGTDAEIAQVAEFGKENRINVINAFDVNNDTFYENDKFFQINTSSTYMYSAVQNMVTDKFNNYRIIFISNDNSSVKPLVEHLKECNMPRQTIDINELKDIELFKTIVSDEMPLLFVPTQSSKTMLASIAPSIKLLKKEAPNYRFALLGYPEWLNYAGYKPFFHSADTYIYARYALDENKDDASELTKQYTYWFGHAPQKSVPQMHIFGYDLATYFINTIIDNSNDFNKPTVLSEGIETCIGLKRASNWGGFVNTSVFMVNYKPDNTTKRTIIK